MCGTNLKSRHPNFNDTTTKWRPHPAIKKKLKAATMGHGNDKQLMMLYKARHIIDIWNSNTHLQTKQDNGQVERPYWG